MLVQWDAPDFTGLPRNAAMQPPINHDAASQSCAERQAAFAELRGRFAVELSEVAFAARLRREPSLRAALETWLHGSDIEALDWEQRKHERLLAA